MPTGFQVLILIPQEYAALADITRPFLIVGLGLCQLFILVLALLWRLSVDLWVAVRVLRDQLQLVWVIWGVLPDRRNMLLLVCRHLQRYGRSWDELLRMRRQHRQLVILALRRATFLLMLNVLLPRCLKGKLLHLVERKPLLSLGILQLVLILNTTGIALVVRLLVLAVVAIRLLVLAVVIVLLLPLAVVKILMLPLAIILTGLMPLSIMMTGMLLPLSLILVDWLLVLPIIPSPILLTLLLLLLPMTPMPLVLLLLLLLFARNLQTKRDWRQVQR